MDLHVRGVRLPDGEHVDLWVREGRVTYEPVPSAATITESGWILPGLVDLHCHVGLTPHGAAAADVTERQAIEERDAGVLLVRDAGSAADTRWIDDREDLPRIVRAGRHIARPKRYIRNFGAEVEADDLAAEVATQAARGDGWVKIVGDWIDRESGDLAPLWPLESLRAGIHAAHAAGVRATTHVFGRAALAQALEAGFDCIEHGTGLDDDLTATMAGAGTALVPTLINVAENFGGIADSAAEKFPAYAAHMRRLWACAPTRIRAAYDAGVPIFAGTDAGGVVAHGRIADEVMALYEAGLPAEYAVGAASWRAREFLGRPGLTEGDPADLIVLAEDPRKNPRALSAPTRVVLRGRVFGRA
ncbi:MAG: amidohydrolase family protein [Sporichthyaceae bacterium]